MGGCARRDQSGVQAGSQAFSRGKNRNLDTIIRPSDSFDERVVQITQPGGAAKNSSLVGQARFARRLFLLDTLTVLLRMRADIFLLDKLAGCRSIQLLCPHSFPKSERYFLE